jgi:hypothetical protein
MELLAFIADVGFPIAMACVGIYFVYLTQKFILESILDKVRNLITITKQLDLRVISMCDETEKVDKLLSKLLELPDGDR